MMAYGREQFSKYSSIAYWAYIKSSDFTEAHRHISPIVIKWDMAYNDKAIEYKKKKILVNLIYHLTILLRNIKNSKKNNIDYQFLM